MSKPNLLARNLRARARLERMGVTCMWECRNPSDGTICKCKGPLTRGKGRLDILIYYRGKEHALTSCMSQGRSSLA